MFQRDVAAAYLQQSGLKVCVLEKRHVIGGAAVTEEIVPGFKFSRASYLLSLLRPQIYKDLELKKYGLKIFLRDPSAYTPLLNPGGLNQKTVSLTLGRDADQNRKQIAQFSTNDAEKFEEYEHQLARIVAALEPLIDNPPLHLHTINKGGFGNLVKSWPSLKTLGSSVKLLGKDKTAFYDLLTAPASKVLDKWFESEPLKACLATDAVIGAMTSPYLPGSGYVLLHHVMGEIEGVKGAWGYVQGGMGAVSQAIANCATDRGAEIFTDKPVQKILVQDGNAKGVKLSNGVEVMAKAVLSNATPKVTYIDLLPKGSLQDDLVSEIKQIDYTSPVTKINVAVKELPNFTANPNRLKNTPMPHHQCTIHLNCEKTESIHEAYLDAQQGIPSHRPIIEMTIPSTLDSTLAPAGCHVISLGTMQQKTNMQTQFLMILKKYAPGFKASIVGVDILTPPDLEKTFGLTGGNIFHGAMGLDQLYTVTLYLYIPIIAYFSYLCLIPTSTNRRRQLPRLSPPLLVSNLHLSPQLFV
ncbi:Pyridine nucleotide-disulfide oxidoreductase domain-containing protein 2 [Acanthosepion pharaonis]|uniref:Pyridine nucleotide-disulfide oxidoreductase domain-containing protein 2 n=1 Tax=Acanthosepion pharaonis TaxID=158019 RepID=A0A812BU95_ACAPH|nr:Pyridine nucleotide-disulfide oxidoreductase domain-containing protein 2 [Sepia pharaonis]